MKYVRKAWFCNVSVFTYFSRTIENNFPHVLGTMLQMRKLIKHFCFWSHFHSNVYVKLFTKEVNLFCCQAQSYVCISCPFAIETSKYAKYRRVDSVFCINFCINPMNVAVRIWLKQIQVDFNRRNVSRGIFRSF